MFLFSYFLLIFIRLLFIIYLWSATSDQTDWKNIFKIIHQQYFMTLNMFCFLCSFNIIVFFALDFDHWYVLYVHNLKHVHAHPLHTICQNMGFLWPIYFYIRTESDIQKCADQRKPISLFEIRTFHLAGYSSGKAEEPLNQNKRSKSQIWVWGSLWLMHTKLALFIL